MNWHYVDQGEKAGPVSDAQLAELNRNGKINADTLVWCEGMSDWMPFHTVKLEVPLGGEPAAPEANKPPPLANTEAVCAECGRTFPISETIRHGKAYICAACKPVFIQKLAEGAQINTGEMNYAGFGVRFGAKFLDGLIVVLPLMVIYFALMIPSLRQNLQNHGATHPATPQLLPVLLQCGMMLVHPGQNDLQIAGRDRGRRPHRLWPCGRPCLCRNAQRTDLLHRVFYGAVRRPKTRIARPPLQYTSDSKVNHESAGFMPPLPGSAPKRRF
jgi:hypothetical protein